MDIKEGRNAPQPPPTGQAEGEPRRLLALRAYAVLDSEPEPEFDALARLASAALGAPVALVGLIDADRVWFKARVGFELPQLGLQEPLCAHALAQPGRGLTVPDLSNDPRFARSPLVTESPHLRSGACVPIVDPAGMVLGSLAVLDTVPRGFGAPQMQQLKDLSVLAVAALLARRRAIDLQRLALTDPLTGIANRAQFDKAVTAELNHAMRTGEPFTVLSLDLDDFRTLNDRLGQAAGDEVLCTVAHRLTLLVRQGDLLARMGGDEFGILMRHGSALSAGVLRERILEAIGQPLTLTGGETLHLGVSVGMAAYTDETESVPELLALASTALQRLRRRHSH
jgi:diguanylate cyclase (GGDEF)-like protein